MRKIKKQGMQDRYCSTNKIVRYVATTTTDRVFSLNVLIFVLSVMYAHSSLYILILVKSLFIVVT
jgi:hypothetical protein